MRLIMLPVCLTTFDGGDAGMGETKADSVNTQQSDSGDIYGDSSAAEKEGTSDREARRKAYMDLINGEYKDIHTEETQKIINRRFKESKSYEDTISQYKEITDILDARYGTKDHQSRVKAFQNDAQFWDSAAYAAGKDDAAEYKKSLNTAVELDRLKARDQAQKWDKEAQEVQKKYPDFDIGIELQNPEFVRAMKGGLSMEKAYRSVHYDELMSKAVKTARATAEKAVADNIKAKGNRPAEAGTAATSGFSGGAIKTTAEQRAKIAEMVKAGKTVDFRNMF